MQYTENLNLKKPEPDDYARIDDLNENADAIDAKFQNLEALKCFLSEETSALLGGIANLDAVIATLLNKVNAQKKHVVGSYTGNGTYGESKPNVLSFDFPFSFFWIVGMKNSNNYFYREPNNSQVVWRLAQDFLTTEYKFIGYWFSSLGNNPIYAKKSVDGKTLSWYNQNNADEQFNLSGYTYYYIAFE